MKCIRRKNNEENQTLKKRMGYMPLYSKSRHSPLFTFMPIVTFRLSQSFDYDLSCKLKVKTDLFV